ncbi:MAG: hypothetical protein ACI8X5_004100 [Planctomycetota bacterium]|jgi:hypothetical protein
MPQPPQIEVLSELVELLIDCADPKARERILVKALWDKGWAQTVVLFQAEPSVAAKGAWTEVLSLGPTDLIPSGDVLRAVYCDELPEELPLNKRVVFGANARQRSALVLCGFEGNEHELDLLEATFQVLCSISAADRGMEYCDPTLLDLLHGALPSEFDGDRGDLPGANELDGLLHLMGGTESLLGGGLGELADQDRDYFDELLENKRGRAADVLGSALDNAADELSQIGDTCVATRLEHLCDQGAWILAQRNIELVVHSTPAARMFTLPVPSSNIDALLEEVLGRLFEKLRRLRGGGGRVDLELERVDSERLSLRIWTQLKRGGDGAKYSTDASIPSEFLQEAHARLVPHQNGEPGSCLELRFERPKAA